jgi:hypothetical protein
VWALPDNQHIWVGGDYAMLLHSHDEGRTWTQLKIGDVPPPSRIDATVARVPADAGNTQTTPDISLEHANPPPNIAQQGPAQSAVVQAPLPAPSGTATPDMVPAGRTVRLQITTLNFRIEKPNAKVNSDLIKIGELYPDKDPSVLTVPITVDPKITPGPYTITISGFRQQGNQPYVLSVKFTVTAAAKSKAQLFSLIPTAFAAEVTKEVQRPAAVAAPAVASVDLIRFEAENSGRVYFNSGSALGTTDGSIWNPRYDRPSNSLCGSLPKPDPACTDLEINNQFSTNPPPLVSNVTAVRALFALSPSKMWFGDEKGRILAWEGGPEWLARNAPTTARINGLFFQPDGLHGWAVGSSGTILSTLDGGKQWISRTKNTAAPYKAPYSPSPAPWYIVSLLLTAVMAGIAFLSPDAPAAPPAAIEIIGASDRPLEDDRDPDPLAFRPIARGIAYFIRNRRTTPPLNFAITGAWGSGKTSLMRLLRHELVKYGFRPVWFNAWHHQNEEYLLPSLLETIRQEAVPKIWNRGGLGFRLRLLNARWQWWFLVLGLCFVVGVAFTSLPNVTDADPASLLKRFGPHGVAIGSVLTMLTFLYKWLSAFGVKPASLLSSSGGGARVSDLEKQTSFRFQFAKEFREVTSALGARQMVVFIDDLDRCQPENTLEVLESVNFLSSSGECFVVMGMAKELVQEYVSTSLENAAKALTSASAGKNSVSAHDLAGEYLQKLINIEVPVPATDADEMKKLVASLKTGSEGLTTTPAVWTTALGIAALIIPVVLAVSLLYEGARFGEYLAGQIKPEAAAASQDAGKTKSAESISTSAESSRKAPPSAPQAEGPENDTFLPPTIQSSWTSFWPVLFIVPALLWAGYRIATWRPDLEPDDSREFTEAMEDALPLILSRQRTPRAVKRFVNKVRFIAMRQRQGFRDDRALWRRLTQTLDPAAAPSPGIPEDVLVILAALHQWNSSSVEDPSQLQPALNQWSLTKYSADDLGKWRGRYLEFASGLRAN